MENWINSRSSTTSQMTYDGDNNTKTFGMGGVSINRLLLVSTSCNVKKKKFYIGDYKLLAEIGNGKFATVALVRHSFSRMHYALKIILKTANRAKKIKSEIQVQSILSEHRNPFIIDFYRTFHTNGHVCHLMEYMEYGNLMQHLKHCKFSESKARFYIACTLNALEHVHNLNIAHKLV
ncbi:hypothetical protein HELRODRAFT_159816 [Helobdella robusta]|uniref:Serine/threonine-protein kinase greatwall n=1 Tax=Helobdella robusta TaxID=6412 RepID=T1EPF7_HELRO|nr:hypothetical protein HELRODRAFT_159816 [Helobdella robusta]ESO13185.1 hypothetical protein HELRODRAFT_159816 [Helobdella robusta]